MHRTAVAMLHELELIDADLIKLATVQISSGSVSSPGSSNMASGSQAPDPYSKPGGATNLPGMSVHCNKCFYELKRKEQTCPKCGSPTGNVFDLKKARDSTVGDNTEEQPSEDQSYDEGDIDAQESSTAIGMATK